MSSLPGNEAVSGARTDSWALTSNPKWLSFSGGGEQSWLLRGDTNLALLEAHIKAAMRSGEPLEVELQPDDPTTQSRVILNCHALAFVVLSERA